MVTITWTWVTLSDGCLVQFRHQKSLVSVKIVSRKSWIHLMRISKVEISQLSRDSQSHSERSCENTHSHWALIQSPCGDTSLSLLISTKRKTHQFTYVLSTWRQISSFDESQAATEEMWHSVSSRHLTQNWLKQISGVWPDSDASLRNGLQDQTKSTMTEKKILEKNYSKTSDCSVSDSQTSQIISGDIYSVQMQSRKVTWAGSEPTWRHTTCF